MKREKPLVDMVNPPLPGFEAVVKAMREEAVRLEAERLQVHREKRRGYSRQARARKRAAKS